MSEPVPPSTQPAVPTVVVIGGGVAGLVAARDLAAGLPPVRVVLLEAGDRVGGKLRTEQVGGVGVDVGAESLLARRPEGVDLLADLGVGADVVHPRATSAAIWSRDALSPMPIGTLMGVPSDPSTAAGVLSPEEVARARAEEPWTGEPPETDVSVGEYVGARLGRAVVDRLVEPLLGGVYAGHADLLSLRAAVPALWAAARTGASLLGTASAATPPALEAGAVRPPVFAGLRGGLGRLPGLLRDDLEARGVEVRTRTIARELRPLPGGRWEVVIGPVPAPVALRADAVVLATPVTATSRLLAAVAPSAAAELAAVEYASMAIVTLAVRRDREWVAGLPGSGFLVPPVDGHTIKAATFSAAKWEWVDRAGGDVVLLRASIGRAGETAELHRDDADLVTVAAADLAAALRGPLPEVVDWHVQRWGGALPQYAVGHLQRVARARAALAGVPGLEVAGAAWEGVGIPAVVASGHQAAAAVATHLLRRVPDGGQ